MQRWLEDNDVILHWTYNEGKSEVTGRFIQLWWVKVKNCQLMIVNLILVIWKISR